MKDINATIVINLSPSEEEIMKNLHKDARWGIRRAEKEGLKVEETNREEDWSEFYKIYRDTMKSEELSSIPFDALRKNTRAFFVCKKDGKIIAGAGVWFPENYKKDVPTLYFNASMNEHLALQPNNLLYWNCILWAKKNSFQIFDFGGWQINARGNLQGVNKFKEKWGETFYYKKDYPLHKAIGRKLIRNYSFFWWLNKKLKKLTG